MMLRSICRPILKTALRSALLSDDGPTRLAIPAGFGYTPPFNIYSDGTTSFRFDSLYDAISPEDITDYYVATVAGGGNDANSGLTALLPKRGIDAAMTAAAGAATSWVRINIAAGDYDALNHPGSGGVAGKNVIFKASGDVYTGSFSRGSALSWTLTTGTTYSASRSNTVAVRDYGILDSVGDPSRYTAAASQVACEATPYSFFLSGSTVYVNTNGEQPNANHLLLVAIQNTVFSSDYTWIIDGGENGRIEFLGGSTGCLRCTAGGVNQKLYCRNVWLRFSTNNNNLYSYGVPFTLFYGGGGSGSKADILNYHVETGRVPTAVEIGVTCYGAGTDGAGNNNCSSMHDGGTIIRVGGQYSSADGPVVADVTDGTLSWNVRCDARNSTKGDASSVDASWLVSTGTAQMWLDHCTYGAGASTSEYDLSVGIGATLRIRGMNQGNVSVAGTLETY